MVRISPLSLISREEFFEKHWKKEVPVLLKGAALNWPAVQLWNLEYLSRNLKNFYTGVETYDRKDIQDPIKANEANLNQRRMNISHFLREMGGDPAQLQCTVPSKINLNEFGLGKDIGEIPFIFPIIFHGLLKLLVRERHPSLLITPKGTITTAHFDFFHNFASLISGRKKWVLFPPTEKKCLYVPSKIDRHGCKSPVNINVPQLNKYPLFAKAKSFSITMEQGDILFLPRHWLHWVETEEFSVSLQSWIPLWSDLKTRKVFTQIIGRVLSGQWLKGNV